ncbi:MAG: hypothetical protein ACI9LM_003723 [Alteromonadaceae bacterium]|jgi:hypothetical protein
MRDLMQKEVSTVSGGGSGVKRYLYITPSAAGVAAGGQCLIDSSPLTTNPVINACDNSGGRAYPDSATVTISSSHTGSLSVMGNGTSAINTVTVTANCGDARNEQ